jgi:chromosome segregation ATPase
VEAVTAAERKKDGAAAYRKKVMMTLASKEARISSLQGEIYDLEREIQNEEDKKIHRREYYRRIGGISRAPILRQDVANKRQEITTLNQQVAALRVELDSISR